MSERSEVHHVSHLLNLVLEAYDGRRAVSRIRSVVTPEVCASLASSRPRHRIRSIHTCSPAEGVIEVCARAEAAGRTFALVGRFVRTERGWTCVRFGLLEPQRRTAA